MVKIEIPESSGYQNGKITDLPIQQMMAFRNQQENQGQLTTWSWSDQTRMKQNYPNLFNPETEYLLDQRGP